MTDAVMQPTSWLMHYPLPRTASPLLQAELAPAVTANPELASRFMIKMIDNGNWALTEFARVLKLVREALPAANGGVIRAPLSSSALDAAARRLMAVFEAAHNVFQVRRVHSASPCGLRAPDPQ